MTTPPDEPRLYPSPATTVAVVVGVDLLARGRLERAYTRHGERLLRRIFTPRELAEARNQLGRLESRFAAKEACAKALGTGFRRGVFWRDLGVVNLASGRPTMRLTGGARRRLDEITPLGMAARLDLTLTDEPPLAQAVVIITAVPAETD